ncbi:hypothetical protein L9F63_006032, partial [Diploptera punctata]
KNNNTWCNSCRMICKELKDEKLVAMLQEKLGIHYTLGNRITRVVVYCLDLYPGSNRDFIPEHCT